MSIINITTSLFPKLLLKKDYLLSFVVPWLDYKINEMAKSPLEIFISPILTDRSCSS